MTKNILLYLILISCLLTACTPSGDKQANTENTTDIPKLLDRPSELAGVEWDKMQSAYQNCKVSIAKKPDAHDKYIKLAEVFMHEARVTGEHGHYYPAALEVLNRVLDKNVDNKDIRFNAMLYKASVMLSQHEFAEAKSLCIEAIKINPYNAQLYGTFVDALVELGEYDKAVLMADKMVSIRPDIRSYARISYLREIHGDLDGAIEAMTLAAESGYPGLEQTAWAILTLGELYEKNNEPDKAKMAYEQILKERENYPFAIAALGKLELNEERYPAAEVLLQKAANIIPEVGYYCDLAYLYKATDRPDKFKSTVDEILVMLQDDVDSGHNMNLEYADLYLNLIQDTDMASKYAEKEYAKRPKNIDVNKMMAEILLAKNDTSAAQPYLDYIKTVKQNTPKTNEAQERLSMDI